MQREKSEGEKVEVEGGGQMITQRTSWETKGHQRQRRHLRGNEARETPAELLGLAGLLLRQLEFVFCHQGSRSCCLSCKLIMLFRFS